MACHFLKNIFEKIHISKYYYLLLSYILILFKLDIFRPFKIEENSHDPYHVIIHDMLYDNECDKITQFLGPMLDFPPGRMNGRKSKNDWTMKNCWPKENQNEELQKLNRRLEHISGLHANSYKNYSEPYMCGNYGIGGHYWLHPDYHFASGMYLFT